MAFRARTAYGQGSTAVRTPRGTEYAVFAKITRRMKTAAEKGKSAFPELAAALHDNLKLWAVLGADVASDGNALPRELRAGILNLAQFTRTHTHKVLQGGADIRPLLEINIAIMKGLASQENAQ